MLTVIIRKILFPFLAAISIFPVFGGGCNHSSTLFKFYKVINPRFAVGISKLSVKVSEI